MKRFISLNKNKLPFIFLMISGIMIVMVLFVLLFAWIAYDEYPDVEGFLVIFIMSGICMPVFLLILGYINWYFNQKIRMSMLKKPPFNQLHQIGFVTSYIDADTKWSFTEETLETEIQGYHIQFNVNREASKRLEFMVFVHHQSLTKEQYDRLEDLLKKEDLYFDFDGVVKKYSHKKTSDLTIGQLREQLNACIQKLKEHGFEPRDDK